MERYLGQTLKGRYRINEIIGVGGMAVVYKAFDIVKEQEIAVKILKDEYMRDEEFRRRFSNESKAITLLSHKNIVDIYDVRLDGEVLFIAMEYLSGVTLKEYIDKVGALDWREATHYIKQVLSAVRHAHERGIIHRDIKPQNIMLTRDGSIKVMDFGIAKVSDFETRSINDQAIGSVHYISPEQASGDALDERADIYSIGIMLYQLCTGALPFDGDNAVAVALMQIQDQPALPRDLNENIPVGLEQIILRAMMKDPLERYAAASEMLRDIETLEENPLFTLHEDEYAGVSLISDTSEPKKQEPEIQQNEPVVPLTKAEKKKLSTKLPIFGGIAAAGLFFLCILIGMFVLPDVVAEEKFEVPNLIDKLYENVINDDEYAHFNIVKKGEKASEKKAGTILSQSVAEFSMVVDGTKIEVYISSGNSSVCVPDIIGLPISKAKNTMQDYQIPFKTIEIYDDTVEKGYVVSTSVPSGDEVDVSTDVVIIYVSKGSKNTKVTVPNLSGMTVDEARSALANVGLRLNETIEEEYSDTVEVGRVIKQIALEGKEVDKGTSVTIYISKGADPAKVPETASVTVSVNFDAGYAGQTVTISIMQGTTVLGAQSITYEQLTNGTYWWNGTADVGAVVTVMVNGTVQNETTVLIGLNTIAVTMVSETVVTPEPPTDNNTDKPSDSSGNTGIGDNTTDGGDTTVDAPADGGTSEDTSGGDSSDQTQGNTTGGNGATTGDTVTDNTAVNTPAATEGIA